MEDFIKEIESKIETLRKNREAVPLDVLKSKYAKAYNELIKSITEGTERILKHYAYEGVRVRVDDLEHVVDKFDRLISECGLSKRLSNMIFKDYNLAAAIDEAKRYRQKKVEPVYKKYLEELDAKQT